MSKRDPTVKTWHYRQSFTVEYKRFYSRVWFAKKVAFVPVIIFWHHGICVRSDWHTQKLTLNTRDLKYSRHFKNPEFLLKENKYFLLTALYYISKCIELAFVYIVQHWYCCLHIGQNLEKYSVLLLKVWQILSLTHFQLFVQLLPKLFVFRSSKIIIWWVIYCTHCTVQWEEIFLTL